jgi:hypothetical protein
MKNSKILTYTPLAKLFQNIPNNISVNLSDSATEFLSEVFTGDTGSTLDSYLHYKDGTPNVVNDWGKTFGLDLDAQGEYALATILNIKMKWEDDAYDKQLIINNKKYEAGIHYAISATNIPNLYNIPLQEDNIQFFVSDIKIPLEIIDKVLEKKEEVDLTLPLVKMDDVEDLSDIFSESSFTVDNVQHDCSDVKMVTKLDIGLLGAEVRQAAVVSAVSGCLSAPVIRRNVIINKPFYVYIKVSGKLAFASYVGLDSFIVNT